MRRAPLFSTVLTAVIAMSSAAQGQQYETTKAVLQRELASFDKTCSLAGLTEDTSLFRYVRERATSYSWPRAWSPRKIMSTLVNVSDLAPNTSEDKAATWIIQTGLREESQLGLRVEYNTDESKDQNFFKERRTCNDRVVAQASANFDYFVKAYSKNSLSISHQGALTITHGTWTSDVAKRVASRDRELYRQLYDLYQNLQGAPKFAVIKRMRAVTVLGTADRSTSARLEAGLSASGGLSFFSGDLQVESSAAVGQTIQLQTVNTLISTIKGKWIEQEKDTIRLPLPDITLQYLPTKAEVEGRLHENVSVDRDMEWISEAGSRPKVGIKILGITNKECDSVTISEQIGSATQSRSVLGRKWIDASAECKLDIETDAMSAQGEHGKKFAASYSGLSLGTVSDKIYVNAVIKGTVKFQGRATDTQLPRWDVEFAGGSVPFTISPWTGTLTFSCADNTVQQVQLSTQVNASIVTFLATQALPSGCKATTPSLRVVPRGGIAIDAPVSGAFIAP